MKKDSRSSRARAGDFLLLTCEHAGNQIPPQYRHLFRGAQAVLDSHRGWDPGALTLARTMARRLKRPLLSVNWSRLLVESNRAPTNRRIWSRFTASLPREERNLILEQYWQPHRNAVEQAVAAAVRNHRVIHVAVHSFTPELDGEVRNAGVTFLYDSRLRDEAEVCHRWADKLNEIDPNVRVRFNYPYRGNADGLTTWLRRRHPVKRYIGVELEINQALVGAQGWMRIQKAIADSLGKVTAFVRP